MGACSGLNRRVIEYRVTERSDRDGVKWSVSSDHLLTGANRVLFASAAASELEA